MLYSGIVRIKKYLQSIIYVAFFLVEVEALNAHYLETRSFSLQYTHIQSSTDTLLPLTVLPAKQTKSCVNFHHTH